MHKRTLAAVVAAGLAATAAAGQTTTTVVPTLTISAEGKVLRAPDVADLSGGVVTTAATAAAAMTENAQRMTQVVAAVRKAGIAERDIQTAGLSLQPQYRYENNQPPVLTGYQATNSVNLRVRKLADTGRLLDALVGVGANQINGPTFRVDAADAALDEARVAAVATARTRAELYAKAAGLRVKRIVSISEGGTSEPGPRPMMVRAMKAEAAAPTPIAPGEVALGINVNLVFELE